jgi:formyltetrahydrofolate deformylase
VAEPDRVDAVVVGAGVVGLAIARALALQGLQVVLLEAEAAFGTGTSSRNSEVVHAGLYYPAGSLKALLCVRGRHLLADFCASHGVALQRCGKLVVATRPEDGLKLDQIRAHAAACGVHDLQPLTQAQAQALEPELNCVAALHSPSSGIVDSHGLMNALLGDAQAAGALFAVASPLLSAQRLADGWRVHTGGDEAFELDCSWLVNAAGLQAQQVAAAMHGFPASAIPARHLARGHYFALPRKAPFRHLDLPHAGGRRPGRAPHAGPGRRRALRARRAMAGRRRAAGLRGGPGAGRGLRGRHPPLLAGPARGHAAAGLCRHPPQAQRPGAARGRLPHRRPAGPWRGRRGAAVRHRITRPDGQPGDRRARGGAGARLKRQCAPAATAASNRFRMSDSLILTLSGPDRTGIVHAVTGVLANAGGNITDAAQFNDQSTGQFFMRVQFSLPEDRHEGIRADVGALATGMGMKWQLHAAQARMRTVLLVSKLGHCLNDLLFRYKTQALPLDIRAVVSNHRDFYQLAASYDIPFHHIPVTPATKAQAEARLLDVVQQEQAELVVLARYMQVLSNDLCRALEGRAINIHHSFLPSFKGARPYHQAHDRGVKIIGATAHYVTADLDEGPIIEQDIARVDHACDPEQLTHMGRDVECAVLARAVTWHAQHRVLVNGHKTVVFR